MLRFLFCLELLYQALPRPTCQMVRCEEMNVYIMNLLCKVAVQNSLPGQPFYFKCIQMFALFSDKMFN